MVKLDNNFKILLLLKIFFNTKKNFFWYFIIEFKSKFLKNIF